MFDFVNSYFESGSGLQVARDAADVFIVYYIFYRLLLVARGTRAIQIAAGLAIVSLSYVAAQAFELATFVTLVGALLQSIILVIVVVFQNDIRRALERVGSRAILGGARAHETEVIEQVVEAARELARHRIGALIAFEQDASLDEFVGQNKGIKVDAHVSAELLVSLFIPEGSNKLHDGAVVIRNLRIARASVFFPMPENRTFDSKYGSRHRAAIGITEETDTVVVVVSEERGTIGFCYNGNMATDLQAGQLREMLFSILSPKALSRERKSRPSERMEDTRQGPRISEPVRLEEAPAPLSTRPPAKDSAPKPLRKSTLPEPPDLRVPEPEPSSVPTANARPMPKAGEAETQTTSRSQSDTETGRSQ